MKKSILASLLIAGATPMLARAFDGALNFTGNVSTGTCLVSSGDANGIQAVRLNTVQASAFNASTRIISGGDFSVTLRNCPDIANTVRLNFTDTVNVDRGTGHLLNRSTSAAPSNVQVGLRNRGESTQIVLGTATSHTANVATRAGNVTIPLTAVYVAVGDGAVTAGPVASSVQFSFNYN